MIFSNVREFEDVFIQVFSVQLTALVLFLGLNGLFLVLVLGLGLDLVLVFIVDHLVHHVLSLLVFDAKDVVVQGILNDFFFLLFFFLSLDLAVEVSG